MRKCGTLSVTLNMVDLSMSKGDQNALQQYTLQGVKETGLELGRGSYATVCVVKHKGLTCAAKNFHPALYQQEYSIRRFQEECAILSQLRHPNIVQFLGIYYHQPGSIFGLPALVMECLPMTLAQCLDRYGVLSSKINYSILKDVALALSYLHPTIIHRDLSANNVLLTDGMTAKVSDLGVAKMLDLRLGPMQMYTMTKGPGTPCYMPPEVLEENAHYNCKADAFSYGVLMVHLFSGQWPFPTRPVKVDPQDDSRVIPQTEADRRQEKLDAIGRDHPLMTLILGCLHNSPAHRPEAVEILKQVSQVAAQFPAENKVELLKQLTSLRDETESLQQENRSLRAHTDERILQANKSHGADIDRLQQQHKNAIWSLRESSSAELESVRQILQAQAAQIQNREAAIEEIQKKLEDSELYHSVEVKQLNLRLADTSDTLSSRVGEVEAELRAAQQQISSKNSALADRDNEVAKLTGQMAELRKEMFDRLTEKKEAFDHSLIHSNQLLVKMQEECDRKLLAEKEPFIQMLTAKDQLLVEKQKEFDRKLLERQEEFVQQLSEKQKEFDLQLLAKEQSFKEKLLAKVQLLAENVQKQRELEKSLLAKEQTIHEKDQELLEKEQHLQKLREMESVFHALLQSKEAILSSKKSLAASKDSTIHDLHEQLRNLRKSHSAQVMEGMQANIGALNEQVNYLNTYLPKAPNPFPRGAKLKWHVCKDTPTGMAQKQAVVFRGMVYIGGGDTYGDDVCLVHQYNPTEEKWSTLPLAPVYLFGLGELNGQLAIVGGKAMQGVTGKVHTFDNNASQKWKESIPPMPTARCSPAVFSQSSCLTVIGGTNQQDASLSDVEVFLPQTSQWHKVSPAPSPLSHMTTTVIDNKCFLAEYNSTQLNSTKVYQLCVSLHREITDSSITPQVITEWKGLPDMPYKSFAIGTLNRCLLAVGGGEWHNPITKIVHCYTPVTNTWKRVGDLPEPRRYCTTVLLPTGELLVMGGRDGPYASSFTNKVWRAVMKLFNN